MSGENEKKSFNRFVFGIPPKNKGDLAFVQHMVATLNAKGICGVVMPHGVLFRGSGDGRIREGMLKADLFEAIIGLPENLFAGTGIPATVLILNKAKPPSAQGQGAVHPRREGIRGAAQEERPGRGQHQRIVEAFRAWKDEDRFCRVVDTQEIEENDFNLNISRYIDTLEPEKPIDVKAELDKLWAAEKARDEAAARMNALLKEMGYVG